MSEMKFHYIVTPNQVYITRDALNPSIATLTIGVTNDTAGDIVCKGIQFTLAIGGQETDISADPRIQASSNQEDWNISEVAEGIYRALPVPPNTGIKAKTSITFQLSGIVVNTKLGTTSIQIKENHQEGSPQTSVQVNKIRSSLNIDSFQGNPVEIAQGEDSTLSWVTTAAARVTLLPGTYENLKTTDSIKVTPPNSTSYYLSAFGEGPSITRPFPITVHNPQITSFTGQPSMIDVGGTVSLAWKAVYATYCKILPPIDPKKPDAHLPIEHKVDVVPSPNTIYSLTAYREDGYASEPRILPIYFNPADIVSFRVTPEYISKGDSITISWETESTVSTTLDPGNNKVKNKGQKTETPDKDITYILTAQGIENEIKQEKTVYVVSGEWKQCLEHLSKASKKPCSKDFCYRILPQIQNFCHDSGLPVDSPVPVMNPEHELCFCCCMGNTIVAGPEGPVIMEQLGIGDTVLAADTRSTTNPRQFSWERKKVAFSSGTGPSEQGSPTILIHYGGDGYFTVTPDTLFLMEDGKLKAAECLVPSKDFLIRIDGSKTPIKKVLLKKGKMSIHHIATSVEFEENFDGNVSGHLLLMNGVIVADYLLQLYRHSPKMKKNLVANHHELPRVGTNAYQQEYKLPGQEPADEGDTDCGQAG